MADASIVQVRDYFGYEKASDFRSDWSKLTTEDKDQLKAGIGNGTFTY